MNRDEPYYEKKVEKFSVVKNCPKCGRLSWMFKQGSISCESCGYTENVQMVR